MDERTFRKRAETYLAEIPEVLLEELNGGVRVETGAMQRDPDLPDVYVLGEYLTDPWLGCQIVLYYGSFKALFGGEPDEVWQEELEATIRHELRHHIEERAGLDDLGLEDEWELERFRRDAARRQQEGDEDGSGG